jgi:acetate kinase
MSILSVNAGSSSLKFALYPTEGDTLGDALLSGNIEGLEPAGVPRIAFTVQGQKETAPVHVLAQQEPFDAALQSLKQLLQTRFEHIALKAVVHRVVRGGHARSVCPTQHLQCVSALASTAQLGGHSRFCRRVSQPATSSVL